MISVLSASGRLNRRGWWIVQCIDIFYLIGVTVAVIYVLLASNVGYQVQQITLLSALVATMLVLWLNTSAMIKRYHDRGKSARWSFLALIPIVGFFWQLVELGFLPGERFENEYGAPISGPMTGKAAVPFDVGRMEGLDRLAKFNSGTPRKQDNSKLQASDDHQYAPNMHAALAVDDTDPPARAHFGMRGVVQEAMRSPNHRARA